MKIVVKGVWLREVDDLRWYHQDRAAALGLAAQNYDSFGMGVPQPPGPATITARQQHASRRSRWVEAALVTIAREHQLVLRDCYAAAGAAADDRAKRYGAAAGAVRAAWRKSGTLRDLEQKIRDSKSKRRPLQKDRDELQDRLAWDALQLAIAAHRAFAEARTALRELDLAEIEAATKHEPAKAVLLAKAAEKLPNPRKLLLAKVAAMMQEMLGGAEP